MTLCFREKKERLVLWLDFEQNMTNQSPYYFELTKSYHYLIMTNFS